MLELAGRARAPVFWVCLSLTFCCTPTPSLLLFPPSSPTPALLPSTVGSQAALLAANSHTHTHTHRRPPLILPRKTSLAACTRTSAPAPPAPSLRLNTLLCLPTSLPLWSTVSGSPTSLLDFSASSLRSLLFSPCKGASPSTLAQQPSGFPSRPRPPLHPPFLPLSPPSRMPSLPLSLLSTLALSSVALAATKDQWKDRVIYQILTDRFAPPSATAPALTTPIPTVCDPVAQTWCGGTWRSIVDKLDYIADMGMTAIWCVLLPLRRVPCAFRLRVPCCLGGPPFGSARATNEDINLALPNLPLTIACAPSFSPAQLVISQDQPRQQEHRRLHQVWVCLPRCVPLLSTDSARALASPS